MPSSLPLIRDYHACRLWFPKAPHELLSFCCLRLKSQMGGFSVDFGPDYLELSPPQGLNTSASRGQSIADTPRYIFLGSFRPCCLPAMSLSEV